MKATERVTTSTFGAAGWEDDVATDENVERIACSVSVPSPEEDIIAGEVYFTISTDASATDKELFV